jgi:acyl carrier protein
MDVQLEVLRVLDEVLSLGGRALRFDADTPLLGAVPELDSMAVVSVVTTLQDRLGVGFHDDDIDGQSFRTVGALVRLVDERLAKP